MCLAWSAGVFIASWFVICVPAQRICTSGGYVRIRACMECVEWRQNISLKMWWPGLLMAQMLCHCLGHIFAQVTHDSQSQKKVKSKVYGVIVHCHWASLHTFNSGLPGRTTITVTLMHLTLQRFWDEGKPTPIILYVNLITLVKTTWASISWCTCSFLSDVVFLMRFRFFSWSWSHPLWPRSNIFQIIHSSSW